MSVGSFCGKALRIEIINIIWDEMYLYGKYLNRSITLIFEYSHNLNLNKHVFYVFLALSLL